MQFIKKEELRGKKIANVYTLWDWEATVIATENNELCVISYDDTLDYNIHVLGYSPLLVCVSQYASGAVILQDFAKELIANAFTEEEILYYCKDYIERTKRREEAFLQGKTFRRKRGVENEENFSK